MINSFHDLNSALMKKMYAMDIPNHQIHVKMGQMKISRFAKIGIVIKQETTFSNVMMGKGKNIKYRGCFQH